MNRFQFALAKKLRKKIVIKAPKLPNKNRSVQKRKDEDAVRLNDSGYQMSMLHSRPLLNVSRPRRELFNEIKFINDDNNSSNPSTTFALTLENGLTQGNTTSTRIGASVDLVVWQLNMRLTVNASATNTFVRVLLVQDKQPNGAAFTSADLLTSSTVNAMQLPASQNRFVIYVDEVFALAPNWKTNQVKTFRVDLNFQTLYGLGNAGTIADITSNSLYLCTLSNEATNTPLMSWSSRVWYYDS